MHGFVAVQELQVEHDAARQSTVLAGGAIWPLSRSICSSSIHSCHDGAEEDTDQQQASTRLLT